VFSENKQAKITKNRYYLNTNGALVRVIHINKKDNRVALYRYDLFKQEDIEFDTAPFYLTPIYKIGAVAKMLNRSTETIRKYERQGLIPKASQYPLNKEGTASVRVYSVKDVGDLVEFFATRSSAGRTSHISKINQRDVMQGLEARFNQIKNVGGKL
jgi:hypothetical protein